jgi:hypothetical protein
MRKDKFLYAVSLLILTVCLSFSTNSDRQQKHGPADGLVPDSITAKKIAEAIWLPVYGKEVLNQRPYSAKLVEDSVWIVTGVVKKPRPGGVAYIEIQKKDCKVLKVSHGE